MSASTRGLLEPFKSTIEAFLADIRGAGIPVRITSGRRTRSEQAELFRRFQAGQSRLPAARPGCSMHEAGFAIDLVFETVPEWLFVASFAPVYGLVWRRRDPVHFEAGRELIDSAEKSPDSSLAVSLLDFIFFGIEKADPFNPSTC